MEAENYLSGGYGHRLAMETKGAGKLGDVATIWQPSRLKGIVVAREYGVPFLAATQVFDQRPVSRKYLSLDKTEDAEKRFAPEGTILLTCSGAVGRATLATSAIAGTLISHDLLRIEPMDSRLGGWIYAYLRAPRVRAMMSAARYGHIIKHLEIPHLSALPFFKPDQESLGSFQSSVAEILRLRNEGHELMLKAEALFADAIAAANLNEEKFAYSVPASELTRGRRRFEGAYHSPHVRNLYEHFRQRKLPTVSLKALGFDIWLPGRFRRVPAAEGVDLVGSADLFEINPDITKHISDGDFGDRARGRVKPGWLLLARSGQTYGLNGSVAIATKFLENRVLTDDVIRIAPRADCSIRAGYVYTALSHPTLGRPLVKALAYGSSIPHIDVNDVERLHIVRLGEVEEQIAELSEGGASRFATADILETELAGSVDSMIGDFLQH